MQLNNLALNLTNFNLDIINPLVYLVNIWLSMEEYFFNFRKQIEIKSFLNFYFLICKMKN